MPWWKSLFASMLEHVAITSFCVVVGALFAGVLTWHVVWTTLLGATVLWIPTYAVVRYLDRRMVPEWCAFLLALHIGVVIVVCAHPLGAVMLSSHIEWRASYSAGFLYCMMTGCVILANVVREILNDGTRPRHQTREICIDADPTWTVSSGRLVEHPDGDVCVVIDEKEKKENPS